MEQRERQFIVHNPRGLHSRPGGELVKLALTLPCDIFLTKGDKTVSAKNMIGVLTLGAKFGETITVMTKGEQADLALARIGELIESVLD